MATKKITEVDVVNSLSDSDTIFVNSSNSLKQISKSKLVTSGGSGEDGGYYTPEVTQPDSSTMRVSFTPSQEGMPAVPGTEITLPEGAAGDPGADGKSAYQYAQEGGYTGTETEFAAKLAQETYSKSEIDAIMGAYINDIDTLVGGEG